MRAPLIVIVGRLSPQAKNVRGEAFAHGRHYAHAVERAGGVPLMLPPIPALTDDRLHDLLQRVDGALFHGGGDIDPSHYGAALGETTPGIVAEHDTVELALMRA
ncbi:MAG TPA: gamma-glutamyl-gamma-aminobutyrate hydrolase family protein, partial [Ilumatobacteraceae bacterium]|nr:gamma-glutamyl-gamma-aminobutyrate hydrolase family protein [Ilumatobacteraceae bacterium]